MGHLTRQRVNQKSKSLADFTFASGRASRVKGLENCDEGIQEKIKDIPRSFPVERARVWQEETTAKYPTMRVHCSIATPKNGDTAGPLVNLISSSWK